MAPDSSSRPAPGFNRTIGKKPGMARYLCFVCATISGLASVFLWVMFYSLYWRHRHHFNGEGRYFDAYEVVVYHQQSWFVAVPAILCLVLSAAFVWLAHRRSRL